MAIDRTERLLNLVICLLGAERPVSRASLRQSIPGYSDATSDEAFERMFERDKDELRHMGIPVDTVVNVQGEVEGYLINQDDYAMPELRLDSSEIAVLGLAARTWNEAALAAEAGAALRKIEAQTGARWSTPPLVVARPRSGEESLPTLWEAIRLRRVVRFAYLARGRDEASDRTVEPWTTVYRHGAWYLVGHSQERGDARAFRLSRVQGQITALRDMCEVPPRDRVRHVIDTISEPASRGSVLVRLPETGAARLKHQARQHGDGVCEVEYADEGVVVAEVLEAGGTILGPDDVVRLQRRALGAVIEAHHG